MYNKLIKYLLEKEEICYLDYHFAKFATGLTGKEDTEIILAAALVSSKTREGHICINLEDYAGRNLIADDDSTCTPSLESWLDKLRGCPIVGKPEQDFTPLILDEKNRLYLYRYWVYETRIASRIKLLIEENADENGLEEIGTKLDELFPTDGRQSPDLQKLAAYTALVKKFCVISGGPGTGKTTTVAKILALLIEQSLGNNTGRNFKIMLAAPTGKAAARLQESVKSFKERVQKEKLNISPEVLSLIPEETSTIHRLLGSIPNSPYFRHNSKNPLRLDVLVIDEASMIDVALMSKLLEALPADAKLIILGDKDQLSSVEAGKFMGDICAGALAGSYSLEFYNVIKDITGFPPEEAAPSFKGRASLRECFIHLKESHRFGKESGIGQLSSFINAGDRQSSLALLKDNKYSDTVLKDISTESELEEELKKTTIKYYKRFLAEDDPAEAFKLFDEFRILCAMREGPFGVNKINELVESIIKRERLTDVRKDWYKGMPIMIKQNNYAMELFNGDTGIVLPDYSQEGKLKAFFPVSGGKFRKIHQLRLPEYEKVYAMTIHKSQGSEFDNVVLILPDRKNPVLTRELLYTGITRARKNAEIWSSEKVFGEAAEANIRRSSGLYDRLAV